METNYLRHSTVTHTHDIVDHAHDTDPLFGIVLIIIFVGIALFICWGLPNDRYCTNESRKPRPDGSRNNPFYIIKEQKRKPRKNFSSYESDEE